MSRNRKTRAGHQLTGAALALLVGAAASAQQPATSATAPAPAAVCAAQRPALNFNRWNENWGALAAPCVPREPLDGLKYMPLGDDGVSYLSLGAGLRERFETNGAPQFGAASAQQDSYLIQRINLHADLRLGPYLQLFGQLEDARAYQKNAIGPADSDRLDLEQLFAAVVVPVTDGYFKARVGRQEMAFDLQRFIAARDGPNVRQAFDGLWADWEHGPWRLIGYATQPVQYRSDSSFDDYSNRKLRFSGVRIERLGVGPGDVSAYYSRYRRDDARFLDATGNERRDVYDTRYNGKRSVAGGVVDYDVEGMLQRGQVGASQISAWGLGSLGGYTFSGAAWTPRLGLQFDVASGDRHPGDGSVGTFNPLFPNGYYFALAGLTGYSNLIHLKPSLTVKPVKQVTVMGALGLQWRETTADAVYGQGSVAVPRTAGQGQRWTGAYAQLRTDWVVSANLTASLEAVHFQVGDSVRAAGGRNADYVGVELKFGW